MNRKKVKKFGIKVVAGICAGTIVTTGVAWASQGNDTVFPESHYREFFKEEGRGDKNYLYTVTEQPAPRPGKCNVFTGDSEKTIAVVCNMVPR